MLPRTSRTRVRLALVLVALAVVVAAGLVISGGPEGGRPVLEPPREAADGSLVTPVAAIRNATGVSVVDGQVRVVDLGALTRTDVDPDTGEVGPARVIGGLGRLDRSVVAGGERWVVDATGVLRLDPDTGAVLETFALEVPGGVVGADTDAVWLTVTGFPVHAGGAPGSVIQRVDRATGAVIAVPVEDPVTFRFAIADRAVWATAGRTLFRLDPVTVEPLLEVELDEPASGVVVLGDVVWAVVAADPAVLVGFDALSGEPVAELPLGPGTVGPVVGLPHGTASAGVGGELWIVRPDDGTLTRVRPADRRLVDVAVPSPRQIAVDGDRLWVTSGAGDGTLWRIDPVALG